MHDHVTVIGVINKSSQGLFMTSNRWDQLLSDSTWYVPAANLLAYEVDSTTSDPTPVSDQTIWSIGQAEGGRFTGQSYATIVNPSGVSNSVVTTMDGVVTKSGQVRITFTNPVGSTITGIGQVRKVNGVEAIEMQMITGNNGSYTTHWAYMLPLTDSTTPPDPATDLGDQTSYFSTKYRWLLGTRWKFDSLGPKTKGVFTISGYRKGYFWGQGRERGSNETFDVLGSITPEGNFFLNAMDTDGFELRFSQGGRLRGPRRQAKAQLRPYTNNQDQFVQPLSLRRIDVIKGKDLINDGGSFSSPVAKPPAGSSLLFGALADSGRIKQRKNGSYRMVLKGVDEIDWFTDRPYRSEGLWTPQKLIRQWDSFFKTSQPNAQASFKVGKERELITFEMFKPKYNKSNQRIAFDIHAERINKRESDLVTGLKGKDLDEVSLFIDDAVKADPTGCFPKCDRSDLEGQKMIGIHQMPASFYNANLKNTNLSYAFMPGASMYLAQMASANLNNAYIYGADFTLSDLQGATLTNSTISFNNFSQANLDDANLENASLAFSNFANANLKNSSLKEAYAERSNFTRANFSGADFSGAYFENADFTYSVLDNVIWSNTTCPDGTKNDGTSPCTPEQLLLA